MEWIKKYTNQCNRIWCTESLGQFRVNNNKWGSEKSGETDATQSVYVDTTNNKLGWKWNRPNPKIGGCGSNYPCPNYPEVIVGTDFGQWSPSTSPYFPIRYGNISTWTVDLGWMLQKYLQEVMI